MRLLIANIGLTGRSGTEVVTMETATGLKARDVDVRVYAPRLGISADRLRAAGVPVYDRPVFDEWVPELIQTNQITPLLAVTKALPTVPAVVICHDATAWHDEPIHLPQIVNYLAVDQLLSSAHHFGRSRTDPADWHTRQRGRSLAFQAPT